MSEYVYKIVTHKKARCIYITWQANGDKTTLSTKEKEIENKTKLKHNIIFGSIGVAEKLLFGQFSWVKCTFQICITQAFI